jgi:hypothetical protein
VQAITAAGTGPAARVTARLQAPERPTDLAVSRGDRRLTLSWDAPAVTGTSAVTGYRVRRYSGATVVTSTVAPAARSFTATGLTPGTGHSFDVTAVNASGAGVTSSRSATVNAATVPGAPVIGTATSGVPGDGVTAEVTWGPPATNGTAAVTGYQVTAYRMSASGTVLSTSVTSTSASARWFEWWLPAVGTYRFGVRAVNAIGPGPESARSAAVAGR